MKIDLNETLTDYQDKIMVTKIGDEQKPVTIKSKLVNTLSAFGNFSPELKNGIKGILSDIARAEGEVELSGKDIELLQKGWHEVCNSEQLTVPLVIEDKVEQFLEDQLEG